ncbi:hypothetical protein QUA82_08880 [Microcoleus sp. F8-D3]
MGIGQTGHGANREWGKQGKQGMGQTGHGELGKQGIASNDNCFPAFLSTVNCQLLSCFPAFLSTVNCQLSTVNCQLSTAFLLSCQLLSCQLTKAKL